MTWITEEHSVRRLLVKLFIPNVILEEVQTYRTVASNSRVLNSNCDGQLVREAELDRFAVFNQITQQHPLLQHVLRTFTSCQLLHTLCTQITLPYQQGNFL